MQVAYNMHENALFATALNLGYRFFRISESEKRENYSYEESYWAANCEQRLRSWFAGGDEDAASQDSQERTEALQESNIPAGEAESPQLENQDPAVIEALEGNYKRLINRQLPRVLDWLRVVVRVWASPSSFILLARVFSVFKAYFTFCLLILRWLAAVHSSQSLIMDSFCSSIAWALRMLLSEIFFWASINKLFWSFTSQSLIVPVLAAWFCWAGNV